jgi:hypothetical protein
MGKMGKETEILPNLRTIGSPIERRYALKYWEEGKDRNVLICMSSEKRLFFVADNLWLLRERGTYEACLLDAYTACWGNNSHWSHDSLKFMFEIADREKLIVLGDKMPDEDNLTLYRGVAGSGRKRRVRSFSWTGNPHCAAWFATRFATVGLNNPAVFSITVPRQHVLCYLNESACNEDEYLIFPYPEMKLKKVLPFPDPEVWQKQADEELNRFLQEAKAKRSGQAA